jgi:hypothetical protein
MTDRRQRILDATTDLVADFLYYDRKEDSLPVGAIEQAVAEGEITATEIAGVFHDTLMKALNGEVR